MVAQLLAAGREPLPLFADYSQRGAAAERAAADAVCAASGIAAPRLLDLRTEGSAFQAVNRLHVPMPHRNLVLLSLALSWASTLECSELAIGLNRDDFGKDADFAAAGAVRYTTGTVAFVERFRELAAVVAPDVEVVLPQAEMSKADVVRLGSQLGVPLESTYSCMRGRAHHCGSCLQCRSRRAAFIEAGLPESDAFYEST
jgi:7-cyano-7-deazaguanine synthase